MKVLVIDDIETSVKGILDTCKEYEWECKLTKFDNAYHLIMEFSPDVIVLDWRQDADNADVGEAILDKIWEITFRPIVIFSANAAIIDVDEKMKKSNLLRVISKGDEDPVIDFLKEIENFVTSLSSYRDEMSKALIESLNSIEYLKTISNIDEAATSYTLAKRTAAFFDNTYISNISPSWVQYLCPPISEHINVCDIIRVYNSDVEMNKSGTPEEYYIVLTPSCDMVNTPEQPSRVTHALCARCYAKEKFHGMTLCEQPKPKNIENVEKSLNFGYNSNKVALPGFADVLPFMTVDLKMVELIKLEEIATNLTSCENKHNYCRIASICSPFREQIVWAHMQNSCRPGVPDRNTELWAKELLTL